MLRNTSRWRDTALGIALFCAHSIDAQDMSKVPITNLVDVLTLPPAEISSNRPVNVRASITCYVPGSQLCFVQDATAGIYVLPAIWERDLAIGDVVEVRGVTASGRFSPIVQWGTLKKTGQHFLPEPKRIAIEELNTGKYDAQLVELEAVVQNVSFSNDLCMMQVWTGGSFASIMAFGLPAAPTNLIDTTVRMDGVAGTFYQNNHLSGFGLFVVGAEHFHPVGVAPEPFSAPLRPLNSLGWFSREHSLNHRIRVRGTVTVCWPGETIFIQDQSAGLKINLATADESIRPGDSVEASGFVRDLVGTPRLDIAAVRKLETKSLPEPARLSLSELLSRSPSGQYITVDGIVSALRTTEKGLGLLELEDANRTVTVVSHRPFTDCKPGARVRVVAAWGTPPSELRNQLGPVLWRDRTAEIAVIAPPRPVALPPAVPGNPHTPLWAVSLAAAIILAGTIAFGARRKITALLRTKSVDAQRFAEIELELQRINDARERLGRDLHDRIIQSIYAIGLNIDDCAQSAEAEPDKVRTRLRSALAEVNGVISELRNVILGLETDAIQPAEFRTALKSLGLALGHEKSNRIRISVADDALSVLTPGQATELIHVAREAMINSIRHGSAQTTTFVLELRGEKIRFLIEDDGVGFDLKAHEGRGFGLRNMAKRAEHLGALFSIQSEKGHGTRVVLDIPRKKPHFSPNELRARIDR